MELFNAYQDASRRALPGPLSDQGREEEEIVKTLDADNSNRGMSLDGEMLRYCGREARVLRRVEQIIEKTGRMLRFKNPAPSSRT